MRIKSLVKKPAADICEVNSALLAAITPVGIEFEKNAIALGENYSRIYGVVQYPSEVSVGWLAKLTNIPGTLVSIAYTPVDNSSFIHNMSKTINENAGAADSTKDQLERSRRSKAAIDAERIMKQIDQNGETVGGFTILIMVLSRDQEDFTEKCARVESVASVLGCRIRILSHLQKEAFEHLSPSYPLEAKIRDITERPMLLSAFTGGYPYSISGFCDDGGYYLGKNSDGGMILFDLWKRDENKTNSNITLIGDSGMGKSTALKHIILSEIARGTKVIIIDPEGEYSEITLSDYVNGKCIDIAGGRGGMINPFQVRPAPKDDEDDDEDATWSGVGDLALHLKTLETFFQLYIPSLDDMTRAILNMVLIELYEQFNITWDTDVSTFANSDFPTFSDLYRLISQKRDAKDEHHKIYEDLLIYLSAATSGADKGLWNGFTTVENDNACICLDTKAVTNMGGNVLSAQYFNILSWCWQQLSQNKKERVMLVADECWMMIDPNCPQSLHFLRNTEKRARKYEGSIVVSTQSIVDFLDPSIKMYGQAVLDIPNVKLIFGMDGKGLHEAKEIFMLNNAQYDLVAAKRRGTALMKVGSSAAKIRFELSDERLKMFGSGGGR